MQGWSLETFKLVGNISAIIATLIGTWLGVRAVLRQITINSKNRVIDIATSVPEGSLPTEAQKAVLTHAFYDFSRRSQADPLCIFHVARDYHHPRKVKYLSQYPKAVVYCHDTHKIIERRPQPRFTIAIELILAVFAAAFTAFFIYHLPALYQDSIQTFSPSQSPLEFLRMVLIWGMIIYPVLAPWFILSAVVRGTYAISYLTNSRHWMVDLSSRAINHLKSRGLPAQ